MRIDGFSLVELVLIMAIATALMAIGTLQFNSYSRKANIESQTKAFYAELMNARQQSIHKKRSYCVRLNASEFAVYSSSEMSVSPVVRKSFNFPVIWKGFTNDRIDFNTKGCLADVSDNGSICVDMDNNPGNYDSLVISWARIRMGKRQTGGACDSDHIDLK